MSDLAELCDQLEALAQAATPGPWHWVDADTDEHVSPDDPIAEGVYRFSLRTIEEFPTKYVGPLPKFIIAEAEEFLEVEQPDGTWTHPDAAYIAAASPDVVLRLVAAVRAAHTLADAVDRFMASSGPRPTELGDMWAALAEWRAAAQPNGDADGR